MNQFLLLLHWSYLCVLVHLLFSFFLTFYSESYALMPFVFFLNHLLVLDSCLLHLSYMSSLDILYLFLHTSHFVIINLLMIFFKFCNLPGKQPFLIAQFRLIVIDDGSLLLLWFLLCSLLERSYFLLVFLFKLGNAVESIFIGAF